MQCLADYIKGTLKAAGLNVRCLASVTDLHYTTIYLILKKGKKAKPYPVVQKALEAALDKIDKLVLLHELPLGADLSHETKIKTLHELFAKH